MFGFRIALFNLIPLGVGYGPDRSLPGDWQRGNQEPHSRWQEQPLSPPQGRDEYEGADADRNGGEEGPRAHGPLRLWSKTGLNTRDIDPRLWPPSAERKAPEDEHDTSRKGKS